jgi:hypothetical protein
MNVFESQYLILPFSVYFYMTPSLHRSTLTHFSGRDRWTHQRSQEQSEGSQAMRLTGVRSQGEGRGDPTQVSRVPSGVVLQQGARCAAQAGARESLRRANSDLRPSDVREASRSRCQVSPVQGGDVLQQEAQVAALVGAREQMRGAALL